MAYFSFTTRAHKALFLLLIRHERVVQISERVFDGDSGFDSHYVFTDSLNKWSRCVVLHIPNLLSDVEWDI